jgi:glucosylceramidase
MALSPVFDSVVIPGEEFVCQAQDALARKYASPGLQCGAALRTRSCLRCTAAHPARRIGQRRLPRVSVISESAVRQRVHVRLYLLTFALALLAACRTPPREPVADPGVAAPASAGVSVWLTSSDRARSLSPMPAADFVSQPPAPIHIRIDPDRRYQRMLGFGAAITDASAWLIQHRMSPAQRNALLRELFGREGEGIGFEFTRLTIGASDFSRRHYSLDDVPPGQSDPELRRFSIKPNRDDVIPVTRAVLAVNPQLKVMASPWSAPAWMKTTGSLIKGTLKPEYYEAFARYLQRYVDAYAAEGIPIFALTLQNEPAFEPDDYPGMRLDARARAEIIGRHLGPMLAQRRDQVEIFDWDHNWDKPEQPLGVLRDPVAARYVSAVAWHCYGGEVSAQSRVRDAFPDKDVYLTECSGGDWEPLRSGGLTLQARRLIVDTTRHWARGVLFWNLALVVNRRRLRHLPRRGHHRLEERGGHAYRRLLRAGPRQPLRTPGRLAHRLERGTGRRGQRRLPQSGWFAGADRGELGRRRAPLFRRGRCACVRLRLAGQEHGDLRVACWCAVGIRVRWPCRDTSEPEWSKSEPDRSGSGGSGSRTWPMPRACR